MIGVDIFCGAGGMSTGAHMTGVNIILGIDSDISAIETFKFNHPNAEGYCCDIKDFDFKNFTNKEIFILMGGPPCQGFSVSNTQTRNEDNQNNKLFHHYIRAVKELKPQWFIFENVEGITLYEKGKVIDKLRHEMNSIGYTTSETVLKASDYGVPQNRNRFFMVGNKDNILFEFPKADKDIVSVEEAISDLPDLLNGASSDKCEYKKGKISTFAKMMRKSSNHSMQNYVSKNTDLIIERYKYIKPGENWKAIPSELMSNYKNINNCHSGIYRRLDPSKPSVVIANYRKNMLIHPKQDRGLSVREAARIQSFPDNFIFKGSLMKIQQQIGNAVPPLLAKAIIKKIVSLELNK